jgi:hypothetical protein
VPEPGKPSVRIDIQTFCAGVGLGEAVGLGAGLGAVVALAVFE